MIECCNKENVIDTPDGVSYIKPTIHCPDCEVAKLLGGNTCSNHAPELMIRIPFSF